MSNAQRRAYATLLTKYAVAYAPRLIDPRELFGRTAPAVVEIGFGMGETTAQIAREHPHNDYLCIEVHTPGVGSLLKQIEAEGLRNVRIIQHDAVEVIRDMLAPASIDAVHIFFPDPWPKKRHHKRRLIQPPLISLLCGIMKPGAYVHVATDWQEYAEQILALMAAEPRLANSAQGFAARPQYRPLTKFEARGLKLGHPVRDIMFVRN